MSRVKGLNDINFVNFYSSGSIGATTSATTKACTIFIQANTFTDNDVFKMVSSSYNVSGGAVAWGTDFYWNTANTLTGAVQISTGSGAAGTEYIQHSRTFKILDKTGAGDGTLGVSTSQTDPNEYRSFNASVTPFESYPIDWTVNSYLMVGLRASSTITMRNSFMKIYTF